jgi:hypothetical protein
MSESRDLLKYTLTKLLEERIPQTIKEQGKNVLICEVTRILVNEGRELGFNFPPSPRNSMKRHGIKSRLNEALQIKYARYLGDYASIKSIVSDFIDEASKMGFSVVPT